MPVSQTSLFERKFFLLSHKQTRKPKKAPRRKKNVHRTRTQKASCRGRADMSDGERDKLVQELKAARDKLKEGEIAKSEMIVKSCRQAGLFTLPDTNGILDAILAKGSHKSMIRTVAYDPQSKQLRTCVNKDTYDAANDFINKGGIDAFKKASGGLMSTLDDFNKAWNDTEKLLAPFALARWLTKLLLSKMTKAMRFKSRVPMEIHIHSTLARPQRPRSSVLLAAPRLRAKRETPVCGCPTFPI